MNLDNWAVSAVRRNPEPGDYMGCSYEQASRRAVAICKAAAESGQTINAAHYLAEYARIMLWLREPKAA